MVGKWTLLTAGPPSVGRLDVLPAVDAVVNFFCCPAVLTSDKFVILDNIDSFSVERIKLATE